MTDRIEDYLRRLRAALGALSEVEREDILAETRSHLLERRESGGQAGVEQAIAAFGPAEDYARAFIDEHRLRAASAGGGPLELAGVLLSQATRRISAFAGFALVALVYVIALACFAVAGMELIRPDMAGLWIHDGGLALGIMDPETLDPGAREVLGVAILPVMVVAASLLFVLGVAISRAIARLLLKTR